MEAIRILLVDDYALFRSGVAGLLGDQPDFELVGEADTGRKAVEKTRELMPDVVLMDVCVPNWDGIETTPSQLGARRTRRSPGSSASPRIR